MMKSALLTLLMCSIAAFAFSQNGVGVIPPTKKSLHGKQIDTISTYLSPLYVPGNKVPPALKNFAPEDHIEITLEGDFGGLVTKSHNDRMPMLMPEGDYTMPVVTPGDSTKNYTLLRKRIE
ncbi:MAG: hypothetical protein RIG68_12920 [Imperialibacter sp.]|uniref:hypothetical protein n=1 Tax=Imperialibacter sp. TaxID=2038411 RepID=UPI0032EE602D